MPRQKCLTSKTFTCLLKASTRCCDWILLSCSVVVSSWMMGSSKLAILVMLFYSANLVLYVRGLLWNCSTGFFKAQSAASFPNLEPLMDWQAIGLKYRVRICKPFKGGQTRNFRRYSRINVYRKSTVHLSSAHKFFQLKGAQA
jgi:hypothetical protein